MRTHWTRRGRGDDPDDEWLRAIPNIPGNVQVLSDEAPAEPELWLPDGSGGWQLAIVEPPRRRLGFVP